MKYYGRTANNEIPTKLQGILATKIINTGQEGSCPYYYNFLGRVASLSANKQNFNNAKVAWANTKQVLATIAVQDPTYEANKDKLNAYRQAMNESGTAVFKYYQEQNVLDSAIVWLKNVESSTAHVQVAFHYLAKGQTEKAVATLAEITQKYDLSPIQQTDYQKLKELFLLLPKGLSYYGLSQEQLDYIHQNFALASGGQAQATARNLLELYGYQFPLEYFDIGFNAIQGKIALDTKKTLIDVVVVYPNPANDYTTFAWDGNQIEGATMSLIVKDIYGKVIQSVELSKEIGSYRLETAQLESGFYFYEMLSSQQSHIQSGKIIIQK
jgi:hypothetical protein